MPRENPLTGESTINAVIAKWTNYAAYMQHYDVTLVRGFPFDTQSRTLYAQRKSSHWGVHYKCCYCEMNKLCSIYATLWCDAGERVSIWHAKFGPYMPSENPLTGESTINAVIAKWTNYAAYMQHYDVTLVRGFPSDTQSSDLICPAKILSLGSPL